MINEPLSLPNQQEDNKGIGAFGFMPQPQPMPDLRQIAENIAKNQAINYIGKKVGIERLGSILSAQQAFGNPLGAIQSIGPLVLRRRRHQNRTTQLELVKCVTTEQVRLVPSQSESG